MAITYHPAVGSILVCDFSKGFVAPEMVKRRPVVVISPPIRTRGSLCTVVPISTEPPRMKMSYHFEITKIKLPAPFHEGPNWVKADMVYATSFSRLELFRDKKDFGEKRAYIEIKLDDDDLCSVRKAVLCAMGLVSLTKHLG